MDALNASLPQIYDVFTEDGVEKRVLNAADTEAAKDKLAKIKAAFETWVWKDVERADRLARIYNDRFNNLVPRHFDGSHLTIPGASSVISFYAHQKRVIWRIVASGTTYVAHAVGAGKTFSLAAAIMEQKRLGLITKAMMVVPGHCLAQASREFLQLYPTARILVADETNFVKDKRQRFLARAATAQWDCIIITHQRVQVHTLPGRFRARADHAADAILFGSARAHRRGGPALAQAHRADEGGPGGGPRAAQIAQGRHADHRRDRRRPADRRRDAGIPQVVVRDQPDDAEGRRSGRIAAGLGPLCQDPLHRRDAEPRPRADRRLRHPDHQFAGRALHPPAVHPARRLAGARHSGIRRLGGQFRGDEDGTRASALRPLQARHPVLRIRQRPRPHGDHSHVDGRRAEIRPAPVSPPARDRGRATPDHGGPGERGLPLLSAPSRRAHQGDRGAAEEAAEGRRHPALGHHRRPPRRDRPPLRPLRPRRTSRRTSSTP